MSACEVRSVRQSSRKLGQPTVGRPRIQHGWLARCRDTFRGTDNMGRANRRSEPKDKTSTTLQSFLASHRKNKAVIDCQTSSVDPLFSELEAFRGFQGGKLPVAKARTDPLPERLVSRTSRPEFLLDSHYAALRYGPVWRLHLPGTASQRFRCELSHFSFGFRRPGAT